MSKKNAAGIPEAELRLQLENDILRNTNIGLEESNLRLQAELDGAYDENAKLDKELRVLRGRYDRLMTRSEKDERLMQARTTALCALIELPDPKWRPKPEDIAP